MKLFSAAYRRLYVLLGVHFFVDLIGGTLAGFLPAALAYYKMDLSLGVIMLTCLGVGGNFLQVPAAQIGKRTTTPGIVVAGLLLSSVFMVLGVLPASTPFWVLCFIMLCVGFGAALVHPHGFRGLHTLTEIPASVSAPVFMVGGFAGYALSPLVGGALVEHFGMKGLLLMFPLLVIIIAGIYLTGVRFAPDTRKEEVSESDPAKKERSPWSFQRMWWIAFFLNTGTITFTSFVPTLLNGYGFSLSHGGLCATLFGLGSACGSLLLGVVARKVRSERLVTWGLCLGIPSGAVYLLYASSAFAALILFVTGFCAAAGFPQLVAQVRNVRSRFSVSTQIGLLVGWTWGCAGLSLLLLGVVAEKWSVLTALWCGILSYLIALVLVVLPGRRREN